MNVEIYLCSDFYRGRSEASNYLRERPEEIRRTELALSSQTQLVESAWREISGEHLFA